MPKFQDVAVVKQSNKAKHSCNPFKAFNALTAAIAELQAKRDMKKEAKKR